MKQGNFYNLELNTKELATGKSLKIFSTEFLKNHEPSISKNSLIFCKPIKIFVVQLQGKYTFYIHSLIFPFESYYEQGESFHQDKMNIEKRYQGRSNAAMMADYECCPTEKMYPCRCDVHQTTSTNRARGESSSSGCHYQNYC